MSVNRDLIETFMECGLTKFNIRHAIVTTLPYTIAVTDIPLEGLKALQQRGANFNAVDDHGLSVVSVAILCDRSNDCVKNLIKFGADPKIADLEGNTPLHLAVGKGNLELCKKATFLVSEGVDINAVNKKGDAAIHYVFDAVTGSADKVALTKLLLANGANIQAKGGLGYSPAKLMMNTSNEVAFELMQVLKEYGADFNCTDEDAEGNSLLYDAVWSKVSMDFIRTLVEIGANPKVTNNEGQTPLMIAVHQGYVEAAEFFLSVGCDVNTADNAGYTALHFVLLTTANAAPMAKLLLSKGANVNAKTERGETPVMLVGVHEDDPSYYFEALEILKEHGADFNSVDNKGTSLLYYCIYKSRCTSLLQKLVDLGADLEFVHEKENNMTLLQLASSTLDLNTADWLLALGADINKKDNIGDTALDYAFDGIKEEENKMYEMVEFLMERGIKSNSTENKHGFTILHKISVSKYDVDGNKLLRVFKKHGTDFNALDNKQRTPLHLAMYMGKSIKYITSLLDHGADPKILFTINDDRTHRFTPLRYAVTQNNLELVKLLISRGCDVNALDDPYFQTPMHALMRRVNPKKQDDVFEITKLFLANGADPNIEDGKGYTVLDEALASGKVERRTLSLLIENGARIKHIDSSLASFVDLLVS